MWTPPLEYNQNGIIERYQIEISDEDNITIPYSTNGTIVMLTVTELRPYHTYNCRIAAETRAGIGPFTSAIIIQTLEDGMFFCSIIGQISFLFLVSMHKKMAHLNYRISLCYGGLLNNCSKLAFHNIIIMHYLFYSSFQSSNQP